MRALILASALLVAAGCASTPGGISDASTRLERSADSLYSHVRSNRDAGLARDAQRFADTAQDFHDEVKARASRDELRNRFSRVSQHYHALRDEMRGEHPNRGEQASFDEVTRAYLDLERELEVRVSGL